MSEKTLSETNETTKFLGTIISAVRDAGRNPVIIKLPIREHDKFMEWVRATVNCIASPNRYYWYDCVRIQRDEDQRMITIRCELSAFNASDNASEAIQ